MLFVSHIHWGSPLSMSTHLWTLSLGLPFIGSFPWPQKYKFRFVRICKVSPKLYHSWYSFVQLSCGFASFLLVCAIYTMYAWQLLCYRFLHALCLDQIFPSFLFPYCPTGHLMIPSDLADERPELFYPQKLQEFQYLI